MKQKFTLLLGLLMTAFATQAQIFTIEAPASIAGEYEMGPPGGGFGFAYSPGDVYKGALAWGHNGVDSLGCDTITNGMDLVGNFGLLTRGACAFSTKVYRSELAGADGTIICNHTPGAGVITMGSSGEFAGITTKPSAFLSFETCALIEEAMAAGEEVSITISVPSFYDGVSAYSYFTPLSQARELTQMGANIVNGTADPVDATITARIISPSGMEEIRTADVTLSSGLDSVVDVAPFLPTEMGKYDVFFTSSITDNELMSSFEMTDFTFGTDNGDFVAGGAGPSDETFANDYNLTYNVGSLALMGADGGVGTFVSFGITNAAELYTGDPSADIINVIVYQGDVDGDGVLDLSTSFDDLPPVAIGEYTLTGNESPDELITIGVETFAGETSVALDPLGSYYTSLQYNGVAAGTGIAPAFIASPAVDYIGALITPLFLDALYSGWSNSSVAIRLHLDGYVDVEDVKHSLDANKVSVSPNPATDFVAVELALDAPADEVRIGLMNFQGQLVQSTTLTNVAQTTHQFDVKDLPSGTYFLSIVTPEGYRAEKFVITK